MIEFAPVRELVPHAPPMLWLRRVVAHDGRSTECEACTDDLGLLLDAAGFAPGYATIELAAQCVAAHARLVAADDGPPRIGFLLGTRRFELHAAQLAPGQILRARVTQLWGAATGPVSFAAEVRDAATAEVLAAGRISCFTPSPSASPSR